MAKQDKRFTNTAPPVKEYINFLAQIAKPEQQASLGRLAVQQQQPGAAPGTPPPSPELASLLARLHARAVTRRGATRPAAVPIALPR